MNVKKKETDSEKESYLGISIVFFFFVLDELRMSMSNQFSVALVGFRHFRHCLALSSVQDYYTVVLFPLWYQLILNPFGNRSVFTSDARVCKSLQCSAENIIMFSIGNWIDRADVVDASTTNIESSTFAEMPNANGYCDCHQSANEGWLRLAKSILCIAFCNCVRFRKTSVPFTLPSGAHKCRSNGSLARHWPYEHMCVCKPPMTAQ